MITNLTGTCHHHFHNRQISHISSENVTQSHHNRGKQCLCLKPAKKSQARQCQVA